MKTIEFERFDEEWYENVSEAQDYVGLNIDDVEKINEQWEEVTQRLDAGELDSKPLVDAVKRTLTTEQDASVRSLLEEGENIPYEEIVAYFKEADRRVSFIQGQIRVIESTVSEKQEQLIKQQQLLASIAPSAIKELEDVTATEIEKLKACELGELRQELAEAEAVLETATALFEKTGRAWPLPELADINYEPQENEIFTIDQFPNEREETGEKIIERVQRKFESRLADASTYLALLLREKPGHIWTGEELGEAVYNDGSDDKRNSGRISALISNYRRGKVPSMAEVFSDELVLQRGKRQLFDAKTGKSIPNTIRVVWRLVDIDTAVSAQIVTTLNSQRTIRESYGEWEPTDIVKIGLSLIPSGEYDGRSLVETQVKHEATEEVTSSEHQSDSAEKVDWKIEFTTAVHSTIEELKKTGLLEKDDVTWKLLGLRTESAKIGTKEMRERALKNKIIKRSDMSDNSVISMNQMILAVMQNSHPNIFRVSSRRKEAFLIVEEIVDGYQRAHGEA